MRPETIEQALRMMADHSGRVRLRGGGSGTRSREGEYTLLLDSSRLSEMSGIHRLGGNITIGCNMSPVDIMHASLIRVSATCLMEGCEKESMAAVSTLGAHLHHLPTVSLIALALTALNVEVEYATLDDDGRITRAWMPLAQVIAKISDVTALLFLAVRFKSGGRDQGSALIEADPLRGAASPVYAAAARLVLDPVDSIVIGASIVLSPAQGLSFHVPEAESLLIQKPITPDGIELASATAGDIVADSLTVSQRDATYTVNLAYHLVRTVLDRAAARATDSASSLPY